MIMFNVMVAVLSDDHTWEESAFSFNSEKITGNSYPIGATTEDKIKHEVIEWHKLNQIGGDDVVGYVVISIDVA